MGNKHECNEVRTEIAMKRFKLGKILKNIHGVETVWDMHILNLHIDGLMQLLKTKKCPEIENLESEAKVIKKYVRSPTRKKSIFSKK